MLRYLFADADARLWVARSTSPVFLEAPEDLERPPLRWWDASRFDVYSSADAFLGVVTLPLRVTLATATGCHVWGIQQGDFGEDYVVRWRIRSTSEEATECVERDK